MSENTETAVMVREPEQMPLATIEPKAKTAQELRVVEVSEALLPAYQKAATCEMTEEEITALMKRFPDTVVEIRPHDGLIYIPHIFISNRLNEVFKPGKWALVRRRDWFDQTSNTMFGEYVLIVRGCYVGEAVGGHPYVPSNPKQNLSDVLESTAAEALRRIAGKRLSCGSQVWEPEYARQWVATYGAKINGKWQRKGSLASQLDPEPASDPKRREQAKASEIVPKMATDATKQWMFGEIDVRGLKVDAYDFAVQNKWLTQEQVIEEWPLEHVPTSKAALAALLKEIEKFADANNPATDQDTELPSEIANAIITVPRRGMKRVDYLKSPDTIGSLYAAAKNGDGDARNRLFGLALEWECKPYVGSDGKTYQPSAEDIKCREALDEFLDWREARGEKD